MVAEHSASPSRHMSTISGVLVPKAPRGKSRRLPSNRTDSLEAYAVEFALGRAPVPRLTLPSTRVRPVMVDLPGAPRRHHRFFNNATIEGIAGWVVSV